MTPISLFKSVVAERRWAQNVWHDRRDGKDYLCLAAAWGAPGTINSTSECPTYLYPKWLFDLMPTLDDGIAAKDVPWLFKGFAKRAEGMAKLSPEAWERIREGFLIGVIKSAMDSTAAVQPDPKPAYWQQVVDATNGVIAALKSGDKKASRAAAAAYAAARAAAAYDDADYAAAAAYAAYAAAATYAADAAYAVAAFRKQCDLLFELIDAEQSGVRKGTVHGWKLVSNEL